MTFAGEMDFLEKGGERERGGEQGRAWSLLGRISLDRLAPPPGQATGLRLPRPRVSPAVFPSASQSRIGKIP
jgi:hypothetical protein